MQNEHKPRQRAATGRSAHGAMPADAASVQATPTVFEDALARLDEIVTALEGGQLRLDESLTLFETGVHLAQECQRMLDDADLRVERLRLADGADALRGEAGAYIVETLAVAED